MKKKIMTITLLLAAVWLAACGSSTEPAAAPAQDTPATAAPAEQAAEPAAETGPVDVYSLPAGVTEEGAFYIGNPDAPVTMSDYSNFL